MQIIGLTGPSGAGKGTVANIFSEFGLPVLDSDEIYHTLLIPPSPCLDTIVARFGSAVLNRDGTLNRTALGNIVFSDPVALQELNGIAHRFVMQEIRLRLAQLEQQGAPAAVLDAPQLFEAHADTLCTTVVSVLADLPLRIRRILKRDNITESLANKRIASQHGDAFFRAHSDYVLENNGDTSDLIPAVRSILTDLEVPTDS